MKRTLNKIGRACSRLVVATLLLAPYAVNAQAEQFKVIKIQGEIQRVNTGLLLSTGDEFQSNEKLNFKTDYSRAAVINAQKGRLIITAKGSTGQAQFLPPSSNISVRASKIKKGNEVLDYFLGEILILENDGLVIDEKLHKKCKDNCFFEMKFKTDKGEISSKMTVEKGWLQIPSEMLQEHKPSTVEVIFHDENGNEKQTEFNPVFANNNELEKEIAVILKDSENKKRNVVVQDVTSFLLDFYGKTSQKTVDSWLKNHLNY